MEKLKLKPQVDRSTLPSTFYCKNWEGREAYTAGERDVAHCRVMTLPASHWNLRRKNTHASSFSKLRRPLIALYIIHQVLLT